MKSLFLLLSLGAATAFAAAPVVSQVKLTSGAPGQPVKIHYTLADAPAVITVDLLTNGVSVGDAALTNLTGAVNARVAPGTGLVALWTPPASFACAPRALAARVTAWATNCPPDYLVVSLTNRQETVRYYTSTNAFPAPLEDRRYRTTHLVMRKIPAAGVVWTMGSRTYEPSRETSFEYTRPVMLTADYYLAIYEMTRRQNQYARNLSALPGLGNLPAAMADEDEIPVGHISYTNLRGSQADADKVWPASGSTLHGGHLVTMRTQTGLALDLPTEAQWEYACRAGTSAQTYLDVDLIESTNRLDEIAWHQGNASNVTYNCLTPHRVGLKKPNAFGLYDMLGNMNEWVLDWATKRPGECGTLQIDPVGAESPYEEKNYYRCMRSGSFGMYATYLRAGFSCGWGRSWNNSMASSAMCGSDATNQSMAQYAGGRPPGRARTGGTLRQRRIAAMKNRIMVFACALAAAASATSTLTVTDFARNPTSGVYTVTYTLAGDPAVVTFGVKLNGTALSDAATRRTGGAVNRLQQPGAGLTLTWCPYEAEAVLAQAPDASLVPVLTAWPTNAPPDYLAIDLYSCSASGLTCPNFAYYTSTNAFPYPVTDRRYKTDYLVMRRIPAKDVVWRMGSPTTECGRTANDETTHYVKLTNDFYMAIYETTHRQVYYLYGGEWKGYASYLIAQNIPYGEYDTYPAGAAVNIGAMRGSVWPTNTYDETAGHIATFRKRTGLRLDLPTDAQWEFACRAGTTNALYTGKEISQSNAAAPELDDIAWYRYNSSVQTVSAGVTQMPHPVGLKRPNPFGLYDMLGNVSEMCLDWYEPITLEGRPDPATTLYVEPVGPDTWYPLTATDNSQKYRRVVRGGGYASSPYHCRAAHRHGWPHNYGDGCCYEWLNTDETRQKIAKGAGGFRLVAPALAVR